MSIRFTTKVSSLLSTRANNSSSRNRISLRYKSATTSADAKAGVTANTKVGKTASGLGVSGSSARSKTGNQTVPLAQTAAAATAGIATVSAAAAVVESATASNVPAC